MVPLFEDVSRLDAKCYEEFYMSEDLLMEHAALGLKDAVLDEFQSVLIVSGAGNNGADGIALSRLLGDKDVSLYLPFGTKSDMAKLQLQRAKSVGVKIVDSIDGEFDLIVDAIFGSGLSRELNQDAIKLIERLNKKKGFKLSCDIPSGIDLKGNPSPIAFIADLTVTMGGYKEALFSDMAKDFVGEIKRANLGVSNSLYEDKSDTFLLEKSDLILPIRVKKNSHKGDFGHLCVVAGKMPGAGIISARAALAFGAGKVTVVENEPYEIPYELMQSSHLPSKITAIAIGMGLGNRYDDEYLSGFLFQDEIAMLIDADLFYNPIIKKVLQKKENLVLTPHPREFVELLKITGIADISIDELQKNRLRYVREFSSRYQNATLLLKGANVIISQKEKIFINPHGTNVLSKGGSGDVLSGMISALLAQGYSALDSAINGSLAHSLAGASYSKNNYSLTPLDLIEAIKSI
ncbi:MAG: bifunctional ADP-dependent NAD(P)H-hydrate dehydratase/NAD(P)H-hydrate epimerase [Sulfurospirillum sp.]|nr:MAG: bifunctional ADP-dependent NAD(P)H-hydrate dehydratase/NAD(P)H-hydrate epimerase [Sulfurospirillum sp.]